MPYATMWKASSDSIRQFFRFGLVGSSSAACYFACLIFLVEVARAPISVSTAVAYGTSMLVNYLGQKNFSFGDTSSHLRASPRYLGLMLALFAFNTIGMSFLPDLLDLHYLVVQVFLTALTVVFSYLSQRFWVFQAPTRKQLVSKPDVL